MTLVTTPEQNNEQQNSDKIQKAYEENMRKLRTILGREIPKNNRIKLEEDVVFDIVTEFFQEKQDSEKEQVKADIKTNLELFIKGNQEIDAKEKELKALKQKIMKEFNESITKLLAKIDGVPDYVRLAGAALNGAIKAGSAEANKEVKD